MGRHSRGYGPAISDYRIYMNATELIDPGPSRTFVLIDMREDSIDMGNFAVKMAG